MSQPPVVIAISGTFTLPVGPATPAGPRQVVNFQLLSDGTWSQWGQATEVLGTTVDLLDALAAAASDYLGEDT